MEGESDGAVVNKVLAYDINLLYDGEKLSNSWSEDGYVDVTFTGAPIQEMTETSDKVEIVAVDDTSKTQLTAEKAEAVEASELKLESVSEQSVEGEAVEKVGFKAEHFTIYAITATGTVGQPLAWMKLTVGQTIKVYSSLGYRYNEKWQWKSDNPSVVDVGDNENYNSRNATTLTAKAGGTANVQMLWGGTVYDSAKVTVSGPSIRITGADSVFIGQTVQLNAEKTELDDETVMWASSDPTIATVDQNGLVSGIKKGSVIIYASAGNVLTSKTIEVKRDESNGHYVYLYTKVEVDKDSDTTGLVLNKDGWYTIGKLWVSGIQDVSHGSGTYDVTSSNYTATIAALRNADNFERYTEANTTIDMEDINWSTYGLKVASGATNYTSGNNEWHLDGSVVVTDYGSVTINHYLKGTTIELAPAQSVNAKANRVIEAAKYKKNIPGYTYVSANPLTYTIVKKQNGTINIYYEKGAFKYKVRYLEEETNAPVAPEKTSSAEFGDSITENAIDVEGFEKVEPTSKTIKIGIDESKNVIIFYYTKQTDLKYTVRYLDKETKQAVADEKTVGNQTFQARVTENAIDVDGYNKVAPESQTITIKSSGNVITFYYTKQTNLSYTVRYLDKETNKAVAGEKTVGNQTFQSKVTEYAVDVDGYNKVAPESQTITIKSSGNIITFYYTKQTNLSYTVRYLDKETNKAVAGEKTVGNQTFQSKVTEYAVDVDGYNKVAPESQTITIKSSGNVITFYYTKQTNLSYTVRYLDKETDEAVAGEKTVGNQTFQSKVTEYAVDVDGYNKVAPESQTITIKSSGNVITFYYTKQTNLSYTVRYLDKETNKAVAGEKTVGNQTFQSKVTEYAVDVDGYNKVAPESQTITIKSSGNIITFYYTKQTNLSYTVRYLDKETNKAVAGEKTVGNQTFQSKVTEYAVDVDGYNKVAPESQTITIKSSGNVITFYYTKQTNLSYTVRYLDKETDEAVAGEKTVGNQTFQSKVTEYAVDVDGYNKVAPESQTITIKSSGNVITFYYTKQTNLSYTVRYLDKETNKAVAGEKTVGNQTFQSKVTEYAVDVDGYNKVAPESQTITIKSSGNVITFYYTKQTNLSYTVRYLDKETDEAVAGEKAVGNQTFQSKVTEYAVDVDGYNKVAPESQTITIKSSGNVITFYYTKQTNLSYTVRYLDKETNKAVAGEKTVGNQTFQSKVTEYAVDVDGYNKVAPESQTIIIKSSGNVITFYYTKQTNLSYTVRYLDKETDEAVAGEKTVGNQTFQSKVTEYAVDVDGYNKVAPESQTITIKSSGNVITFYYTKQTNLSYTVRYLDKETDEAVAGEKTVGNQTFQSKVTEYAVDVDGYNKVAPESQTITIKSSGNVITFYYTKQTNLSYTVRYLDKETNKAVAGEKAVGNQTFQSKVTEYAVDVDGYNKVAPESQTITIKSSGNVITFYYTKQTNLSYTVRYLDKETNKAVAGEKTVGNQTFQSKVTEYAVDVDGYNKVAPESQTITIKSSGNVITFYYTKQTNLSYTVRYLDKETDEAVAGEKTVGNQTFQSKVTEYAVDVDGYNKVAPFSQTIAIESSGNVITFYYEKRTDLSYTVNYLENGSNKILAPTKTVNNQKLNDRIQEVAIDIAGYDKIAPSDKTIIIDADETKNVITFYYVASSNTTYKVEVYYEQKGKYSSTPNTTDILTGTTDTQTTVKAEDYLPTSGYVFDQSAANVLSGTIAGDNSLVLKVYYKQVFKVTYAPGDHGSFKSQTYTVSYGNQTPGFSGDKTANGNYRFTGWDKTIESKVTGDIVYTAQWAANSNGGGNGGGGGGSSSGGGGGSSSGPRDNGSTPSGGPGATTVTIDPDAVPLANLPNEDGAADLLVIDDEDVPLAALPKTGQSGASGLVFFLSSMMLAAFVAVTKKREDDK